MIFINTFLVKKIPIYTFCKGFYVSMAAIQGSSCYMTCHRFYTNIVCKKIKMMCHNL